MARTIMYRVTMRGKDGKEHFLAVTHAKDSEAFVSYHYDEGRHLEPDYAAIREAIPHQWRKAYDKTPKAWWYPATLHSRLTGQLDGRNACHRTLYGAKGRRIGTIIAIPYLYSRGTTEG